MAYGDFKDLARRTASDKVLRDKADKGILQKFLNMTDVKEGCLLWYKCFDKNPQVVVSLIMRLNKIYNYWKN